MQTESPSDWSTGAPSSGAEGLHLAVLGGFRLCNRGGTRISLSRGSQRLLVYLALQRQAVSRVRMAGDLWPDATDQRSLASLRSELWRLQELVRAAVEVDARELCLADTLRVDLYDVSALARRLTDRKPTDADLCSQSTTMLSMELLPGWYEDWVLMASEAWSQLRLHALESLARTLVERGRHAEALGPALDAARAEPLRESAHAVLMQVHLAEGNQSEALRTFQSYRELLRRELGVEPTERLADLLSTVRTA